MSSHRPSKLCLSCHGASVAPGNVLNGWSWLEATRTKITRCGDLLGNHPVGIPYPDIRGATYNSITTATNPFLYIAKPAGVKIYGPHVGAKGIECTSCHDIHGRDDRRYLLRVPFENLCASCHIK